MSVEGCNSVILSTPSAGGSPSMASRLKGIADGLDMMAPMPNLFYQLLIGNDRMKNNAMNYIPLKVIKEAIGFVQDPNLKRRMYKFLRARSFSEGVRNQSVIINEISGMYGFVKRIVEYGSITIKMHMDK